MRGSDFKYIFAGKRLRRSLFTFGRGAAFYFERRALFFREALRVPLPLPRCRALRNKFGAQRPTYLPTYPPAPASVRKTYLPTYLIFRYFTK